MSYWLNAIHYSWYVLQEGSYSGVRVSHVTLMPTCMGESPEKGTLLVAISHRMTAKLYMSAALLSMSSGLCCRAGETRGAWRPHIAEEEGKLSHPLHICLKSLKDSNGASHGSHFQRKMSYLSYSFRLMVFCVLNDRPEQLSWLTAARWKTDNVQCMYAGIQHSYCGEPSGAIQLGEKTFSFSMKENRVWHRSSFAVMSSSIWNTWHEYVQNTNVFPNMNP